VEEPACFGRLLQTLKTIGGLLVNFYKMYKTWSERLYKAYEDKQYKKMMSSILCALLLHLFLGGLAFVIIYFWGMYILLAAIIIAVIVLGLRYLMQKRKTETGSNIIALSAGDIEKLDRSHEILLSVVLDTVTLKADMLKLITPSTSNDIRVDPPYTSKGIEGKAAWSYHRFQVHLAEAGRNIPDITIRDTLQNALSIKISEGAFGGDLDKARRYEGVLYEPVIIDSIEAVGRKRIINYVFINDNYLTHLTESERERIKKQIVRNEIF
jgi:hypothetical protein